MGGGASQATKQQQQVNLQASQQQLAFNQQLMGLFQQQFASQQNTLNFLKGIFQPVISDAQQGNGFSAPALAAMRTSATDQLSSQFQNAQSALNQQLRTQGSPQVQSGVTGGLDLALFNQEAQAKAAAQNQITLANAAQGQSNLFNAANVLNGVAAETNPLGYANSATSGSGTIAGLSGAQSSLQNAITNANANSFGGMLSRSFANSLGSGLGGMITGTGSGTMLGNAMPNIFG